MKTVKDANGREYKQTESGTCYYNDTPDEIITVLESLDRDTRIRIWLGKDGVSWNETNDTTGYVGRSTGSIKIPLLIANKCSHGGGSILTDCIVKIVNTKTKRTLYQHPHFKQASFTVQTHSDIPAYRANVLDDNGIYARCHSIQAAVRLCDFMNGLRMSK